MPRPDCKYSRSFQRLCANASIYRNVNLHVPGTRVPPGDRRAYRASSRNTIATTHCQTCPETRQTTNHPNAENKNGAALFRYCAVLCYSNSDLYGADGETRTLTPCGAGT